MYGFRIGKHNDHVFCALCEGTFYGLRHMYFAGPLLGTDGIAVKRVDHRKPPAAAVGRRKIDDDLAAVAELGTPDVVQ